MPMYEYACRTCDHTFLAQRSTARRDEAPACPACAGSQVSRQLATFMIRSAGGSGKAMTAAGDCGPDGCGMPARSHGFGCACCS